LMLRLQDEAAQRGSQNHVSNAQQQSIHVSNEINVTAKKTASVNSSHSSNEMNLSARKKNKSGDALQQSLSTLVVSALEGASTRSSNPSSVAATPTSRCSSVLEVPLAGPPGTITASPSGALHAPLPLPISLPVPVSGVWTVSPQRTASPPVTSTETAVNVLASAVEKDVAGNTISKSHYFITCLALPLSFLRRPM
jgi:hypothetical protein